MKMSAISGNGFRGFLVSSLLASMLLMNAVSYSNSPTIITDTLTMDNPSVLNDSWNAIKIGLVMNLEALNYGFGFATFIYNL